MFENARAGDWVWSVLNGWGKVEKVERDGDNSTMAVTYERWKTRTYRLSGKASCTDQYPEIYWDEINFTSPSPPERWVKEEGWLVPLINTNGFIAMMHNDETKKLEIHETYNMAVRRQRNFAELFGLTILSRFPDPVKITYYEKEG